jgi:hypothetical protein
MHARVRSVTVELVSGSQHGISIKSCEMESSRDFDDTLNQHFSRPQWSQSGVVGGTRRWLPHCCRCLHVSISTLLFRDQFCGLHLWLGGEVDQVLADKQGSVDSVDFNAVVSQRGRNQVLLAHRDWDWKPSEAARAAGHASGRLALPSGWWCQNLAIWLGESHRC